jgi:predicted acylesterase/phospholipase RssA
MVTAPLGGRGGKIGHRPATSFEAICDFHSKDFATRDGLEAVFKAASASAAFPLVFAPVELPHWGRCIDGGCVNNTPIKWALDGEIGETIDTVVVIGTQVEHRSERPEQLTGLTPLVSHLAEMLIDERLYRDLREAEQVNDAIGKLEALARAGHLDATQLAMVRGALGWSKRRQVPIVAIRPDKPLDGSAFGAFFDPVRRARYVEAGFHRALDVLAEHKFPHRPEPRRSVRDDHVVAVAAEPVELPGAGEGDRPE